MKKHLALLALGLLAGATAFADQKVSDRVSLSAASLAPATDILPIVDVSTGTAGSKKITVNDLFTGWGVTADGKTLVTGADFAAMRTSLGLVIGTNVQAYDADLTDWAGKTAPTGTAVGTTDAQTLTNKTLTSPVLNVGSDATGDLYYRNSGVLTRLPIGSNGQVLTLASGLPSWATPAGLVNWTEGANSSSPNATTPVVSFTATNAATHADAAVIAKGVGALLAQVPDSTSTGGDKRGQSATDWQRVRSSSTHVASGLQSVVGGGNNNQAASSQSTVAGGNSNAVTAGQYSAIGGGTSNTVSATSAVIAGGASNSITGDQGAIGGGDSNTVSGTYATVPGGRLNTADGDYSSAQGYYSTTRAFYGAQARAAGRFATTGDAQAMRYLLRMATTNATTTEMSGNGSTASSGSPLTRIPLPNNHAYHVRGRVVARDTSTGDAVTWEIKGLIKRGANAAATAVVGTPTVTLLFNDSGAATWTVAISADTTNGSLKVQVTGEASKTIHWLAEIETLEVS